MDIQSGGEQTASFAKKCGANESALRIDVARRRQAATKQLVLLNILGVRVERGLVRRHRKFAAAMDDHLARNELNDSAVAGSVFKNRLNRPVVPGRGLQNHLHLFETSQNLGDGGEVVEDILAPIGDWREPVARRQARLLRRGGKAGAR